MARVNAYTALRDPNGRATVFAPGDELPSWAKVGDHMLAGDDEFLDGPETGPEEPDEDKATPAAGEDLYGPETGSEDPSEANEEDGEWTAAYPDEDPSTDWSGAQLQAYAADYGISLSGATSSKAKMVERIQADH